jgi:hypothetical protein
MRPFWKALDEYIMGKISIIGAGTLKGPKSMIKLTPKISWQQANNNFYSTGIY